MNRDYRTDDWMYPVREPVVPTMDEIMLADALRHRLEMRLLPVGERPDHDFGAMHCAWAEAYHA